MKNLTKIVWIGIFISTMLIMFLMLNHAEVYNTPLSSFDGSFHTFRAMIYSGEITTGCSAELIQTFFYYPPLLHILPMFIPFKVATSLAIIIPLLFFLVVFLMFQLCKELDIIKYENMFYSFLIFALFVLTSYVFNGNWSRLFGSVWILIFIILTLRHGKPKAIFTIPLLALLFLTHRFALVYVITLLITYFIYKKHYLSVGLLGFSGVLYCFYFNLIPVLTFAINIKSNVLFIFAFFLFALKFIKKDEKNKLFLYFVFTSIGLSFISGYVNFTILLMSVYVYKPLKEVVKSNGINISKLLLWVLIVFFIIISVSNIKAYPHDNLKTNYIMPYYNETGETFTLYHEDIPNKQFACRTYAMFKSKPVFIKTVFETWICEPFRHGTGSLFCISGE